MPEIVLRHSEKSVLPYVLDVPLGVNPDEVGAAYAVSGWTVDKSTSPADARVEHDKGVAKAWAKFAADNGGQSPVALAGTAVVKDVK